jgi:hypothetical protein
MVIIVASTQFDAASEDLTWNLCTIVIWASVEVNLVTVSSTYSTITTYPKQPLTSFSMSTHSPTSLSLHLLLRQSFIPNRLRLQQLRRSQLRPQPDQEHDSSLDPTKQQRQRRVQLDAPACRFRTRRPWLHIRLRNPRHGPVPCQCGYRHWTIA